MRHLIIYIALMGCVEMVSAQEKDSTQWLNDVVVTGTRTPKLLKDTPIQTKVIRAEDIEKVDATNVEDLL